MNNTQLMGNLARDPETKEFQNGNSVTNFCLAVNKSVKEGDKWVDKAVFIDCKMWGNRGKALARNHSKGDQVLISKASLDVDTWDTDAGKRSKMIVLAQEFEFTRGKGSTTSSEPVADESDTPF